MTGALPIVTPLDCPDCGQAGTLALAWKPPMAQGLDGVPWTYQCRTPECPGFLLARRDGSPVGRPGDAETRRLRKALERRLASIRAAAPSLRARTLGHALNAEEFRRACNDGRVAVSRWLAKQLGLETSSSRVAQLDKEQARRALELCAGVTFREVARWNLANPKQVRQRKARKA